MCSKTLEDDALFMVLELGGPSLESTFGRRRASPAEVDRSFDQCVASLMDVHVEGGPALQDWILMRRKNFVLFFCTIHINRESSRRILQ